MHGSALAAAMLLALAGQGAGPLPLAPSGKWVVDYHPNMCAAMRWFGEGADRVELGFRPLPLGDRIEIVMVRPDKPTSGHRGVAAVALDMPGTPHTSTRGDYLAWTIPKTRDQIVLMSFNVAATEHLAEAATLTVTLDGKRSVTVAMQRTGAVLAALKTCTDNLLTTWGIDPAESDRVATVAQAIDPADWILDSDYPRVLHGAEGTTTLAWSIGLDGRVSDCRVVSTSGYAEFDTTACQAITKRGRYKPAIGRDGKPMVTHSTRRVVWRSVA